jgi:hypothetical protein
LSGFSISAKLGMPPYKPNKSIFTDKMYSGNPITKNKNAHELYLIALGIHGFLTANSLLILLLIVPVEEGEVLI